LLLLLRRASKWRFLHDNQPPLQLLAHDVVAHCQTHLSLQQHAVVHNQLQRKIQHPRSFSASAGHLPVLRVIQSVKAAAPQLQLHLFKSATNQHLYDGQREMRSTLEEVLARVWYSVDEVNLR
jgi:hypothetical protein